MVSIPSTVETVPGQLALAQRGELSVVGGVAVAGHDDPGGVVPMPLTSPARMVRVARLDSAPSSPGGRTTSTNGALRTSARRGEELGAGQALADRDGRQVGRTEEAWAVAIASPSSCPIRSYVGAAVSTRGSASWVSAGCRRVDRRLSSGSISRHRP